MAEEKVDISIIINESQKDQAEDSQSSRNKDSDKKAIDRSEDYWLKKREENILKALNLQNATEAEQQEALLADKAAREAKQREEYEKDLETKAKMLEGTAEGEAAKRELAQRESLRKFNQALADAVNSFAEKFGQIQQAGKDYADYVERIEVGLIGSTKNYNNVTNKLDKVFSMNAFFSMKDALDRTTEMIEKGISSNVELRASLDVFSEKIVKTFDAMDETLLRIVRIQGQDSTMARLGMESLLKEYLTSNFENSEYLGSLYDQVSATLLEAESLRTREEAVGLEYAIQKWLGSMSSIGVSDATILALAQGLGYLGSGDVSSLVGNNALQQLMAISVQRGSEKSYGELLASGSLNAKDVSSILTGFYGLVKEISDSGNMVAMKQYADLFGLSMSDIMSVLKLTDEQVAYISQDMISYSNAIQRVNDELSFSNVWARTSKSGLIQNIKDNAMASLGLTMANSLAMNIMYDMIDQVADIVDMFTTGIEVDPFGVGGSVKIDAGGLIRGITAATTLAGQYATHLGALGNMFNLRDLGNEDEGVRIVLQGGSTGLSQVKSGTVTTEATYIGNTSKSAVYETVNQESKASASSIINEDIDEEKERMKKTQKAMEEIGDNVEFIVQLLNVSGILIRDKNTPAATRMENPLVSASNSFYGNGGY